MMNGTGDLAASMQDFISVPPRHEPVTIIWAFIVLGRPVALFTTASAALNPAEKAVLP
jgi:hypothetical protein